MNFSISLFETGPRDGLQNEAIPIDQATRKEWILALNAAGLKDLEIGALVREDRVPQMAGSQELFQNLATQKSWPGPPPTLWMLAPNLKGLQKGQEIGCQHFGLLAAASDTFNQKNIGKTVQESLQDLKPQMAFAAQHQLTTRIYLSCAWHCPYEGPIPQERVCDIVKSILDLGASEIVVSDTIGKASPSETLSLGQSLLKLAQASSFAFHFHDTYAMALANCQAALGLGFGRFDASAGGLGGCPYAKGASGNVATEDLAHLLASQSYDTGVSLSGLVNADLIIEKAIQRDLPSKVFQALKRIAA